tara:strand:- start:1536 stop:1790 length:255 start_codon:yes stop_codon:yes gene_type:complete
MMTDSPGKKSFLLRISDGLHAKIKSAADKGGVSMSAWITMAVMHWLDLDPDAVTELIEERQDHLNNPNISNPKISNVIERRWWN